MKKSLLLSIVGILLLLSVGVIIWLLIHKDDYNPLAPTGRYERMSEGLVNTSMDASKELTEKAVDSLRHKKLQEAADQLSLAITTFPMNSRAYGLLIKLYLMSGQEQKIYETLNRAGRSYPDFDQIVSVLDDEDLAQLPLEAPSENIYLANFPENKKMAMSFMMDDGEANVYDHLAIFEKYGFRATIPIVAGMTPDKDDDPYFGSWREWGDAVKRGFEIANHSMYHRDSRDLRGSDFDVAIDQAKEMIEKRIGVAPKVYVFPADRYTDEAVSRALMVHEAVRTPEFLHSIYDRSLGIVYGGPHVSVNTVNRLVDIGIKRHLWLIAQCHGISMGGSRSYKAISPAFLDTHLAYIRSQSKNIWVDTFSNIFEYMSLRKNTTIESKSFSADSVDFVLHSNVPNRSLSVPLTIIVRKPTGGAVIKSAASRSRILKAWDCGTDKICVDVTSYDDPIHLQWQ